MNPFIQAAKELIYKEGVSITYSSVTTGVYNVETGEVSITTLQTALKAFPKVLKPTVYSFPSLIGKTVSEWLVVAPDLSSIPKALDKITRGSEVFTVDSFTEHTASGEPVMYKIIAVKG